MHIWEVKKVRIKQSAIVVENLGFFARILQEKKVEFALHFFGLKKETFFLTKCI